MTHYLSSGKPSLALAGLPFLHFSSLMFSHLGLTYTLPPPKVLCPLMPCWTRLLELRGLTLFQCWYPGFCFVSHRRLCCHHAHALVTEIPSRRCCRPGIQPTPFADLKPNGDILSNSIFLEYSAKQHVQTELRQKHHSNYECPYRLICIIKFPCVGIPIM